MSRRPIFRVGTPGWQQMLVAKQKLLGPYDIAYRETVDRHVKVEHGCTAEAIFRAWLKTFLPKRYDVTAGYVLSQRSPTRGYPLAKLSHFDVIIYDQLASPVLWWEGENKDRTDQGFSRAIPVEHIRAILEVKASLTPRSAREAISHLALLKPFWEASDSTSSHPCFLSRTAVCGVVFFELRKSQQFSPKALDSLIAPYIIRSQYIGGIVLRGEGLHPDVAGRFSSVRRDWGDSNVGRKAPHVTLTSTGAMSKAESWGPSSPTTGLKMTWDHNSFSEFLFELVACLNESKKPYILPSLYGRSYPQEAPLSGSPLPRPKRR